MTSYIITHLLSGRDFGTYEESSPNRALAAMLRDAGIRATVDVQGTIYLDPRDVDADGVHLAGDLGDYSVRKSIEVLAAAMVDGDTDDSLCRDAILAGDTECHWEMRDVRALAQDIGLGSLDVDAQWDAIRAAYEAAAEEYRESECADEEVECAYEEVECAYCGRSHVPPSAVPALYDDHAWADMAREHADYCEWIRTRAHRVEIVRVFQGDHESSDDGWANDAYAILRDSGVWVREGVDGCCSWEECSGYQNGVEYVTMRVDSRAAARPALVEHGFVVRADTAD